MHSDETEIVTLRNLLRKAIDEVGHLKAEVEKWKMEVERVAAERDDAREWVAEVRKFNGELLDALLEDRPDAQA